MDKKLVGARIKRIRHSLGLTMEQFGLKIDNASKGMVSNWEHGLNLPNKRRIKLIADLAGISPDALLFGSVEEFFPAGLAMYNLILNSKKTDSHTRAAFEYYSGKEKDELIRKALLRMQGAGWFKGQNVAGSNGLSLIIEDTVVSAYQKEVKSNGNLLAAAEDAIVSFLIELESYNLIESSSFILPDSKNIIQIDTIDESVDESLKVQLNSLFDDTLSKIHKIKLAHPDRPSDVRDYLTLLFSKNDKQNQKLQDESVNPNKNTPGIINIGFIKDSQPEYTEHAIKELGLDYLDTIESFYHIKKLEDKNGHKT